MKKFFPYKLADDIETYGENAGKFILTDETGENEICGPIHDEENVSLLASAPDLLEACEAIDDLPILGQESALESGDYYALKSAMEKIRKAIRKAKEGK